MIDAVDGIDGGNVDGGEVDGGTDVNGNNDSKGVNGVDN